jgi:hypothetical protein
MAGQGMGATLSRSSFFPQGGGLVNQTGQTLYKGNVVEVDWIQANSKSTPSTTQLANGQTELDLSVGNAVLCTSNGFSAATCYAVVRDDGPVATGATFKAAFEGFEQVQINPNLSQVLTYTGNPTGGSLIFALTTNGTLSYSTATFSATIPTNQANLLAAIGASINGTGVGTNSCIITNSGTYSYTVTFIGSVVNPSLLSITSASTSLTGGTTPAGAISVNTLAIQPGTALSPVAQQTYLQPVLPNTTFDINVWVGTALVSHTLTVILPSGLSYVTGTIAYSATLATYATNIQNALNALAIPGLFAGNQGFTCVALTATGATTISFRVTVPLAIAGAVIAFPPLSFINSTLSNVTVNTGYLANSGPFMAGPATGICWAGDNLGSPTINTVPQVVAGSASTTTGNPGIQQNAAAATAPSNASGASNPLTYNYPQFTINAYVTGLPARRNAGIS